MMILICSLATFKPTLLAVISEDGDLEKACDGVQKFLYFKSIGEYLDYIQKAHGDHYNAVLSLLHASQPVLDAALGEEFTNRGFHIEEDDGGGEFCNIKITSINQTELNIIELDHDTVTFAFGSEVSYTGTAIYNNYETAFKDDDTKEWIPWEKKEVFVEETEDLCGDCVVRYDLDKKSVVVERLSLDNGDIYIQAESINY